ncbi:hypothetical protein ACFOVU_19505 [Nocardiopsis sediminis]|uniref:Protein kinase domain-containing protein n=1 Tax=Nocardiopsis sediminis TaxID=1778267 RepID=A0ABV8FPM9_9ACTN
MTAGRDTPDVPGYRITELLRRTAGMDLYRARAEATGGSVLVRMPRGASEAPVPHLVIRDERPDSLGALLESHGALPAERVVAAGLAVAVELEPLHEAGLVHNGIAPGTLLFRGGAAELAPPRVPALRSGKPFPPLVLDEAATAHLPPEAFDNGLATPRSDVYRLASTMWTLLTGHAPGNGGPGAVATGDAAGKGGDLDQAGTVAAFTTGAADGATTEATGPAMPHALDRLLRRAMDRNPRNRPADAGSFARALADLDAADGTGRPEATETGGFIGATPSADAILDRRLHGDAREDPGREDGATAEATGAPMAEWTSPAPVAPEGADEPVAAPMAEEPPIAEATYDSDASTPDSGEGSAAASAYADADASVAAEAGAMPSAPSPVDVPADFLVEGVDGASEGVADTTVIGGTASAFSGSAEPTAWPRVGPDPVADEGAAVSDPTTQHEDPLPSEAPLGPRPGHEPPAAPWPAPDPAAPATASPTNDGAHAADAPAPVQDAPPLSVTGPAAPSGGMGMDHGLDDDRAEATLPTPPAPASASPEADHGPASSRDARVDGREAGADGAPVDRQLAAPTTDRAGAERTVDAAAAGIGTAAPQGPGTALSPALSSGDGPAPAGAFGSLSDPGGPRADTAAPSRPDTGRTSAAHGGGDDRAADATPTDDDLGEATGTAEAGPREVSPRVAGADAGLSPQVASVGAAADSLSAAAASPSAEGASTAVGDSAGSGLGRVVLTAVLAASLVIAVLGAVALAVAWWSAPRAGEPPVAETTAEGPSPSSGVPPAAAENPRWAPTGVRIQADTLDTVTLSWTDNTQGRASFHIVGGPVGTTPATMAEAEALGTQVEITGLNPAFDYCFTVVAVLSVDEVASSQNICTSRFAEA